MAKRPSLRQLEYFVSACEQGTFAAAAGALHVSQPSLSEQIATLERTLGVRLFNRTTRGLLLTDAGRTLLPHARETLASVDELSERMRGAVRLEEGLVSFGTFNSAHLYFLTDLIRQFHAAYPDVRMRVTGANSAEIADLLRAGELEAGIVQLPIKDAGLRVSRPVFTDHVVYVSVDADATGETVTIKELARRPMILSEARWSQDDPLRRTLTERAQQAGVVIQARVEVEFQTHALELAAQGIGDTLCSYHVARSMFASGRLHWVGLDPPVVEHYAFATRKNSAISPATAEFMRMARMVLRHLESSFPAL